MTRGRKTPSGGSELGILPMCTQIIRIRYGFCKQLDLPIAIQRLMLLSDVSFINRQSCVTTGRVLVSP